ncbi:extracellular solute-binding protein [Paenibacillus sp. 1P07SE]|uniref:extracellular solute-binding protein n=1 Tax=Paenibacillus sp. 1P07SE TaxID=3132209 RepID=UPI0039A5A204
MSKSKSLAVLLSLVFMLTAVLGACSSNSDPTPGNTGESSGSNAPSGEGGTSAPVKISVAGMPKYPPNQVPNDYITEVEERFNMDWDYEAIPLSAGMEKYNVMFASGQYPDFIPNMNSPSSVAKWASAGFLLPISDYIDQLPAYRGLFTDEDWEVLMSFAATNGKLYMLPSVASSDPMTWIYRKDAFEKIGLKEFPSTMDELYEALNALKAEYPQSVGIGVRGGTENTGIRNLMNGFRQSFRNPRNDHTKGFWNDPDAGDAVVWNMASEKHREMLIFLAKLYKEGLIEKEFATLTQEQWKTKRLTGSVLVDFQYASHTIDPEYALTDIPGGEWAYARTLPSAGTEPALEFSPLSFALFGPIFSSKLANEPEKLEKLFEYIEFSASPEGQLFHHMGLKDVTYTEANGEITYAEGYDRQTVAEQHGFDWLLKQSEDVLKSDPMFLKKQEAMEEVSGIYNLTPKSAPFTEEEQQTINTTVSAMEDVAYQFATRAVMGIADASDDAQWAKYLDDLGRVGMAEAQSIAETYLSE